MFLSWTLFFELWKQLFLSLSLSLYLSLSLSLSLFLISFKVLLPSLTGKTILWSMCGGPEFVHVHIRLNASCVCVEGYWMKCFCSITGKLHVINSCLFVSVCMCVCVCVFGMCMPIQNRDQGRDSEDGRDVCSRTRPTQTCGHML